ncbi:MAG: hypothetical protein IIA89_15615, partial [Chloroflexi bacterium]|nr:hypothetical protein [Chloroflexota bacterium]
MGNIIREEDEAEFTNWLRRQGLSEGTIRLRRTGLRHFVRWYYIARGKVLSAADLTEKDL